MGNRNLERNAAEYLPLLRKEIRPISVGEQFHSWEVLAGPFRRGLTGRGRVYYRCRCDCGTEAYVLKQNLRTQHSRDCGCSGKQVRIAQQTSHGECATRLYRCWRGMLTRCRDVTLPNYGGRGITFAPEWEEFVPFREWALANGYADNLTLERKDPNGNYEPRNCTWVPLADQPRNRRDIFWVTAFGETKPAHTWLTDPRCAVKSSSSLVRRIQAGWGHEEALTTPGSNHRARNSQGQWASTPHPSATAQTDSPPLRQRRA